MHWTSCLFLVKLSRSFLCKLPFPLFSVPARCLGTPFFGGGTSGAFGTSGLSVLGKRIYNSCLLPNSIIIRASEVLKVCGRRRGIGWSIKLTTRCNPPPRPDLTDCVGGCARHLSLCRHGRKKKHYVQSGKTPAEFPHCFPRPLRFRRLSEQEVGRCFQQRMDRKKRYHG